MASVFRKTDDSEKNAQATLYVGNLDPQVNEPLLYELFTQFGPIKSINLPKDRLLKTHQGFGFVEFRTGKDAEYTLNVLSGIRLFGKMLNLRKNDQSRSGITSNQKVGATTGPTTTSSNDIGAKLFIKNLNPLIDEKYLEDTFSKFGNLVAPPLLVRDDTGNSKKYAFLSYDDFASSDEVIAKMNNSILMNSKISISYAFKEDSNGNKKVRHGDEAERLLAESAKANRPAQNTKSNKRKTRITKPKKKI
ncbi:RNA-binding domain-containing protein [Hyphopichia burtonii NRRL Y-1933]|uniref:RNA-binding domain-containing protein n=1 Tax=Hyphopichia burtonii NRRL Y-1933 TaxID=984485 RepID=A0A1E4RI04_9ASCO|nr:RNA-binding domain-containing protein [Hyphopichia burtonii NRRL Y-1933]ODV66894.1 RNA-binding domain-containing protein [Hyphopichia burtonii NRRL Y-1933]